MKTKLSTAALRRLKKQRHRGNVTCDFKYEAFTWQLERAGATRTNSDSIPRADGTEDQLPEGVVVEYLPAQVEPDVPEEFAQVFRCFAFPTEQVDGEGRPEHEQDDAATADDSMDEAEREVISKKKLKLQSRMGLAELKQHARHPEVVEWEDVTAKHPKLLVHLKSLPHTVPIPRHWNQKRKYLSGKRGYVKPPFELPAFIRDTGITELRDTMRAQDVPKTIKVKAREKMHPKLGRITVDYERLYDAFFKYQTKPPLTRHGELYYEGKEFEGAKQEKKPGYLSEELRLALGMTSHIIPPPWLHNMQKYGPPPSYPHMKIPGLSAPIPDGAQWGYHPGGWGKPPVDNLFLRDAFENSAARDGGPMQLMLLNPIERNLWGELEPDEEVPAEEAEDQGEHGPADGIVTLQDEDVDGYYQPPPPQHSSSRVKDAEPRLFETAAVLDTPEALQTRKHRR